MQVAGSGQEAATAGGSQTSAAQALHEATGIPELATGKLDNTGRLSGLALQILYALMIQKTESKRRTYGHAITETMRRALDLSGFGDQTIVDIVWLRKGSLHLGADGDVARPRAHGPRRSRVLARTADRQRRLPAVPPRPRATGLALEGR